ncbi:MAG TPA: hypothetical protein VK913_00830 [Erythrobacter sp.]|nr:hypothetical protein [Erythrobacter sp.]
MNQYHKALLLGGVLIAIAVLAVFDIIPQQVAQYAPLAVVPFIVGNSQNCRGRLSDRRS